jgi:hypothetical protein
MTGVDHLCAMAAVMEHQNIALLRPADELRQARADVRSRGLHARLIGVEQNQNVGLVESEPARQSGVHPLHIVGAAMKLHFRPGVIAPYQQRSLRHRSQLFQLLQTPNTNSQI